MFSKSSVGTQCRSGTWCLCIEESSCLHSPPFATARDFKGFAFRGIHSNSYIAHSVKMNYIVYSPDPPFLFGGGSGNETNVYTTDGMQTLKWHGQESVDFLKVHIDDLLLNNCECWLRSFSFCNFIYRMA